MTKPLAARKYAREMGEVYHVPFLAMHADIDIEVPNRFGEDVSPTVERRSVREGREAPRVVFSQAQRAEEKLLSGPRPRSAYEGTCSERLGILAPTTVV